MENIWSFLLQTLSVSLIGLLLLVVKLLLRNRLSPRWQYAVWGVLAVRLMVPASTYGKDIFLPLPLWVETVKLTVEQGLSSAYTAFYEAVRFVAPVPWLSGGPVSVTDWLFLLYILGVFGMLGWELFASLRLRRRFQNGEPVSAQEFRRLQRMGEREGRTICAAVFLPQLTSPMVCGVFHLVLGLPANKPVEETAILHAFLYPTRWNILQSGFWRVCRALHWCNPVMWFFLRQVNHDWVSFCDHQVLERLQEEEQEGYDPGRLTGTSAIFDGEKDLKEQAEAAERRSIAPKGRTLVAVCVTVVLLCSSLLGTVEKTVEIRPWWEGDGSRQEMVAISHCNPCTTAAGALDTYAKGMMQENPLYCAMASPEARRKQLEDGFLRGEGQKTASETVLLYPAVSYDQAAEAPVKVRLEDGYRFDTDRGYRVQNLKEKDGGQTGLLILYLYTVPEGKEFVEKDRFDDMELTESYLPSGQLVCPVRVWREENRYVVEETGERAIYLSYDIPNGGAEYCERMVPELEAEKAVGKYGTMTVHRWSVYQVDNEEKAETSVWDWERGSGFCEIPKPDAAFSVIRWPWKVSYQCVDGWQDRENLQMVGLHVMPLIEEGEQPDFSELDAYLDISNLNASGSDNRGVSWNHCRVDETWDGEVTVEGVCETDTQGLAVRLIWNFEEKESFTIRGGVNDGP